MCSLILPLHIIGLAQNGTAGQAVDRLFQTNRPERLVMLRFTPHYLRRTVKTQMAKLGIPKEVRDAVQNHKPTGIGEQVYNVWNYMPEKRDALERLEGHILGLVKKGLMGRDSAREILAFAALCEAGGVQHDLDNLRQHIRQPRQPYDPTISCVARTYGAFRRPWPCAGRRCSRSVYDGLSCSRSGERRPTTSSAGGTRTNHRDGNQGGCCRE